MNPLTDEQKKLVEDYHALACTVAHNAARGVPRAVSRDELVAAGLEGLVKAAHDFDPARGIKFSTFMPYRVRGAVLDYLRDIDTVPRLVRARTDAMDMARTRFFAEHGRMPAEGEIKRPELNVGGKTTRDERDYDAVRFISIDKKRHMSLDGYNWTGDFAAVLVDKQASATDAADRADLREHIWKWMDRQERLIIALYYYEGMTMRAIGKTIGVTESRVYQVMQRILRRLKATLSEAVLS